MTVAYHEPLIEITRAAGAAILEVYETSFAVQRKSDSSPLTEADLRAHRVIVDGLEALDASIPIISEESDPPPYAERCSWSRYWLVDPLDGTKEFVNRNGEFTVNIALIEDGESVLGVVGVPVQGRIYLGDVREASAFCLTDAVREPLATRALGDGGITIVASRSHGGKRLETYLDAIEARFGAVTRKAMGSSLKLCVLAEGGADFYPRLGPTSEWDIGAAHAVLAAAGGEVLLFDGTPVRYNQKEEFLNPDFMAVADRSVDWIARLPALPG